jgi:rod shape determining protein RodA
MLGLTVLYSASAQDIGLVSKQAMSFGIGFLVMCGLAQIPPKVYQAFHLFLSVWTGLLSRS